MHPLLSDRAKIRVSPFPPELVLFRSETKTVPDLMLISFNSCLYVNYNRFIDLTINSYTNPSNLASSRLCDSGPQWFRLHI